MSKNGQEFVNDVKNVKVRWKCQNVKIMSEVWKKWIENDEICRKNLSRRPKYVQVICQKISEICTNCQNDNDIKDVTKNVKNWNIRKCWDKLSEISQDMPKECRVYEKDLLYWFP